MKITARVNLALPMLPLEANVRRSVVYGTRDFSLLRFLSTIPEKTPKLLVRSLSIDMCLLLRTVYIGEMDSKRFIAFRIGLFRNFDITVQFLLSTHLVYVPRFVFHVLLPARLSI